jgi:hypothetical protein
MTSAGEKKPVVDARIIDLVIKDIGAQISAAADNDSGLPHKLDVAQLASSLGFEIRRGQVRDGEGIIPVPAFYSDREMRLEVTRKLAHDQVRKMANACRVSGEKPTPQNQFCAFVSAAESDRSTVDLVAAAMLMPTEDFRKWGKLLDWQIGPLADSYAVPQELALLRKNTVIPKGKSDD